MCLYTTQTKSLIAKKDITCYKVVHLHENETLFRSEFRFFEYKIGRVYSLCTSVKQWVPNQYGNMYSGFHSFTTLRNALTYGGKHMALLKCVIPKGARYYVGDFGNGSCTQYCSNRIRVVAWKPMWRGKWSTEL